jgi:hypothetical protein
VRNDMFTLSINGGLMDFWRRHLKVIVLKVWTPLWSFLKFGHLLAWWAKVQAPWVIKILNKNTIEFLSENHILMQTHNKHKNLFIILTQLNENNV